MDFDIGSNQYRNAADGIEIDGMAQFLFEHNRRYNEMMLRGLIFDQRGSLVAKIAENSLAVNLQGEFEMRSEPQVVKLLRRETEDVLLEVKFLDGNRIQIHKAKLYTGKGKPFEVTPALWKLKDETHSGETVDCDGKPVSLK
jgi:ATP-dependent DNA ligase